jgi:hypothetical protein
MTFHFYIFDKELHMYYRKTYWDTVRTNFVNNTSTLCSNVSVIIHCYWIWSNIRHLMLCDIKVFFTLVMKFHDRESSERCIRKLISRHCLDKTRTRWNDFLFLITDDRDFRPQTGHQLIAITWAFGEVS